MVETGEAVAADGIRIDTNDSLMPHSPGSLATPEASESETAFPELAPCGGCGSIHIYGGK